jgi:predicted amidophosphoribosyltransferase
MKGNTLSKDEWRICPSCKCNIGKWDTLAIDKIHCKHCFTKLKHGVVDINNCFQGSVITLD